MGKEIKIGLAVILALLVVFGVVLVQRLRNPADATEAAAESDNGEATPDGAKPAAIGGSAASGAAPTKGAAAVTALAEAADSRWAASDRQSTRSASAADSTTASDAAAASDAASPYRLDPDPPAATDRYADRSAATGSSQSTRTSKTSSSAADEAYDPYPKNSATDRYTDSQASEAATSAKSSATKLAPVRNLRQTADPSLAATENPLRSQTGRTATGGSAAPRSAADSYAGDASAGSEASRYGSSSSAGSTSQAPAETGLDAARGSRGTYVVEPNDNYWTISRKVYGNEGYFNAIKEHNRGQYPRADRLRPGDVIAVPAVAVLRESYPDLCPKPRATAAPRGYTTAVSTTGRFGGRTYVVEEGDTLFDIARHELGKVSRWAEIYDLNQEVVGGDFDYLRPGTRLTLPSDQAADNVTRNPASDYQR